MFHLYLLTPFNLLSLLWVSILVGDNMMMRCREIVACLLGEVFLRIPVV